MAKISIHKGSAEMISPNASSGLLFLKAFVPLLNSLVKDDIRKLQSFFTDTATYTAVNNPPRPAKGLISKLVKQRVKQVERHTHELHTAWDIAHHNGAHTIMYESTSTTVLKDDKEAMEGTVKKFILVELVMVDNKLKACELRTFMDSSPLSARVKVMSARKSRWRTGM